MIDNPKSLKNEKFTMECLRLGNDFSGICSLDGFTVFVPGALPGETIEALILRVDKSFAYGKLLTIIKASPYRTEPACEFFGKCGGCSCMHMEYEKTLEAKTKQVKDCLLRISDIDIETPLALGADNPYHIRNKASIPVSGEVGNVKMGFYRKRSHSIIDIRKCPIAMHGVDEASLIIRKWMNENKIPPYNEAENSGLIRHVVVRVFTNGDIMITLVTRASLIPKLYKLIDALKDNLHGFASLHQSINNKSSNVIMGEDTSILYGSETVCENILGLKFIISPISFLQVNPYQTEKLYKTALDFANAQENDICIDAYSGAGTLSLALAGKAKTVYGLEIAKDAVSNAIENAKLNNISNAQFIVGAIEKTLPELVSTGIKPNIVILDPPRKGCDESVINALCAVKPKRIVYVSCNPATQARDIKLFVQNNYKLVRVQPVDMFCFASGIENVALLEYIE